jgi:hypothetical protein
MQPSLPGRDAPCPSCGALLWGGQPGSWPRPSHRWRRVLWKACLFFVTAAAVLLVVTAAAAAIFVDTAIKLAWSECVVLALLTVLLFGRKLPEVARWVGYRIAGGR